MTGPDIILVNPPDSKSKYKEYFNISAPPLGIAYIASVLEGDGINVEIIDCAAEDIGFKSLKNRIRGKDPLLCGITSTTPLINEALESAKLIKRNIDGYVALGGPHPTFLHEKIIQNCDYVDFVVRGEGEITFLKLFNTLENGEDLDKIKGITYKDGQNEEMIINEEREPIEDLDKLPYPARHLLPNDSYKLFDIDRITTMTFSRGCPMSCSFCASSAMHGRKVRKRSATDVINEIKNVKNNYNVKNVAFMDDTFTLFPEWVRKFCSQLINKDIDIGWGCTARVDKMDEDLLKLMREAGCHTLFIGVESGVQEILDSIKKGTNIKQIKKAFHTARGLNFRTIASLAIGLPGETKDTIKESIEFVKNLEASYALFSVATPYPGTEFYKKSRKGGLINIDDWSKYNLFSPILETTELSLIEVKKLQKKAFKEFYLRPAYLTKMLWREGLPFLKIVKSIFGGFK